MCGNFRQNSLYRGNISGYVVCRTRFHSISNLGSKIHSRDRYMRSKWDTAGVDYGSWERWYSSIIARTSQSLPAPMMFADWERL